MNAVVRNLETTESFRVRTQLVAPLAEGVTQVVLAPAQAQSLPPFEPGAHVELFLPNGLARCYSLINPLDQSGQYRIAVQKDRASRGGSAYVVDHLKEGAELVMSGPRNHFRLVDSASHVRLIAGGIGVTPLWAMAQALAARNASWDLFYAARSRSCAAFVEDLRALDPAAATFWFDDEHDGRPPILGDILSQGALPDSHVYCCGPNAMLREFERLTQVLPRERVHVEYFTAKEKAARLGGFTVELRRSGRMVEVAPGETILDALLAAGMNVRFMCTEGVCGECETPVISGDPDHRDSYLTEEERKANKSMMICCSGAKSERLVLDL